GGLFGVPSLPVLAAAGAVAGLDVEAGDEGDDGRQVGLVLDDHGGGTQGHAGGRAFGPGGGGVAGDLLGRGDRGVGGGGAPWGAPVFWACRPWSSCGGMGGSGDAVHVGPRPAVGGARGSVVPPWPGGGPDDGSRAGGTGAPRSARPGAGGDAEAPDHVPG